MRKNLNRSDDPIDQFVSQERRETIIIGVIAGMFVLAAICAAGLVLL